MEGNKLASSLKKELAVFYIDRNQAVFYSDGMSSAIPIVFPPDIISDLEILSREKLQALLQAFIEVNSITPKHIIMVLAKSVTFEKDISFENESSTASEMQKFLDVIPFEQVVSREFRLSKSIKLIAANKDFCDSFRRCFLSQNFSVSMLIPASVLSDSMSEFAKEIDVSLVLKKIDMIKQYNLLSAGEATTPSEKKEEEKKHSRLLITMTIFSGLAVVLLLYVIAHTVFGMF